MIYNRKEVKKVMKKFDIKKIGIVLAAVVVVVLAILLHMAILAVAMMIYA